MFTSEHRQAVSDRILEIARADERVVAAALVGSLVHGGDRWSDLDLTFGVAEGVAIEEVLSDWTRRLTDELDATLLFDLPSGNLLYRVFMLPDALQVDVSFSAARDFGAGSPRFRLLFGNTVDRPPSRPPAAAELFGWAVVYVRDARACIERGRLWQAEHAISAVRDHALALACLRHGLPARFGRGYDDLPPELLQGAGAALAGAIDDGVLRGALSASVELLLRESAEVAETAARVAPSLRELAGIP
jgi:predicted nucleotidyltransferase